MCNITSIRFNKTDGPSAPSWFPPPSFLQSENINFYIEVFDQLKFNNAVKLSSIVYKTVGQLYGLICNMKTQFYFTPQQSLNCKRMMRQVTMVPRAAVRVELSTSKYPKASKGPSSLIFSCSIRFRLDCPLLAAYSSLENLLVSIL